MATCVWTGAGDGITFTSAGNWDTGAPTNGDTVRILTGNSTITAGLSPGISVASFEVGEQFTGTIGSAGTSLTISVTGTLIYNGRASICNITAGGSNIAKAKALSPNALNLSGGTWTILEVGPGGNAYVTSSATVTTLYGTGGNCIAESGAALTTVEWDAGRFQSARNVGTASLTGAGTVMSVTGTATGTTVKVGGGSRLNWRSSGTITTLHVKPGATADAQGNLYPFTISTANEYAGLLYSFDNEAVTVTKSSVVDIGMA